MVAVVGRRGRTGTAVAAKLGASGLLGFLLRRRRLPEDEEPAFEESSDSSSRLRRSSMIASFDTPLERSGMAVIVGEESLGGIVIRW